MKLVRSPAKSPTLPSAGLSLPLRAVFWASFLCAIPFLGKAEKASIELRGQSPDRRDFFATGVCGFAEEEIMVPLRMESPQGGIWKLEAEWLQVSGNSAAPIAGRQVVVEEVSFAESSSQSIEAVVKLPKVERESKVIVRFLATRTDGADPETSVATIAGYVFPDPEGEDGLITALRSAAKASRFRVEGEAPRIREFFTVWDIPFDGGSSAETGGVVFYEGTVPPGSATRDARWLWFAPPDALMPGIYPPARSGDKATKITLPLLEDLQTDPFAQKTLLYLVQPITSDLVP
ncbi:hypothetical protein [Puniceicoccus vermicola]|uniref:Uncharacterized protein n=1 Tax=Puniceicoccus vermicola TaxID=388746 RepID=A0A7X1AZR9_9BACT|nr:hypothetical protein [Puniceicoccus vermicola]MBC2602980.1 hypothetical protein [Puniceicoccus vermicola]